jgi:hypothetical protein
MAEKSDVPRIIMMINDSVNRDMAAKMRDRFLPLLVPL